MLSFALLTARGERAATDISPVRRAFPVPPAALGSIGHKDGAGATGKEPCRVHPSKVPAASPQTMTGRWPLPMPPGGGRQLVMWDGRVDILEGMASLNRRPSMC